jgi:succinyl-diaminopimelate desuccinylase
LDTVNADINQLSPRKKNGRIFGRGACDTKGSVASMFMALCDLSRLGKRPSETEILFAGLVDEENAQAGSRALGAMGIKADLAIVGEPTRLQAVTAHKGSLWLELKTRGKSAHGARPELGKNAIHSMARVVNLLETTYAAQLRSRAHPLLGHGTINVGFIQGGTQPNIVPDTCEIKIDRRTLPGETESSVRREIRSLLQSNHLRAVIGNAKLAPCLPLETDPKLPLVSRFLGSIGQKNCIGVDYFCDASVLSHSGIPSIVFGPGDIAQAHTSEEWISIKSLETARKLLASFLRSLP